MKKNGKSVEKFIKRTSRNLLRCFLCSASRAFARLHSSGFKFTICRTESAAQPHDKDLTVLERSRGFP